MKLKHTMMKIDAIWSELENDDSFRSGILFKRFSATIVPDVYVALRAPEKLRCIAALLQRENQPEVELLNKFRDIKVEILHDERNPEKSYLLIVLLNKEYKDIFSVLCEDLINQISSIVDETNLIKELLNRLAKWQTMFEKLAQQGLTPEAQRGLYGELFFLRKFLKSTSTKKYPINSWQVPSNKVQDFHYGDWAVEVKTTHGNNHQKIHISSERQLDDSIIQEIFLYHLSLDLRSNHGESLNDIVEWIESNLKKDIPELNTFKLKLFEVGYFDIHKSVYKETGFTIRQESIYKIKDNFPRIKESEVRNGVGDVKYSIIIADCLSYLIDESQLFKSISIY